MKNWFQHLDNKGYYEELIQNQVKETVTKTIKLMEKQATPFVSAEKYLQCYNEGFEAGLTEQQKKNIVGIIRHEPIDVDSYKCGYEAATKEIVEKNIVPDSTATIIHKNGYDEGYAACVREIEEKLSKDNTISFDSWKQGWEDGCTEFANKLKETMDEENVNPWLTKRVDTVLKEMTEKKEGKE